MLDGCGFLFASNFNVYDIKYFRLVSHEDLDVRAARSLACDNKLLIFDPQAQNVVVCVIVVEVNALNVISEPMALLILEMDG